MSAISETYNHAHNILELVDILPNISFATNWNVIITNKIGEYKSNDELPNDVRLKSTWGKHTREIFREFLNS